MVKSDISMITVNGPANVQLKKSAKAKLVNRMQRIDDEVACENFCLGTITSSKVLAIVPIRHKKIKAADDTTKTILLKIAGS